jgi:hypothetical protein
MGKVPIYNSDVSHEECDWAVGREVGVVTAVQVLCCAKSYKS